MEIGHNVMHGQYDWTATRRWPSTSFEWDAACPADQWRHSHNYLHHTFTNIHGKDRDIGYGILRISPDQPWNPIYLGNPLFAAALALNFDHGVMLHDVEIERVLAGTQDAGRRRGRPSGTACGSRAIRASRTTCSGRRSPGRCSCRRSWPTSRPT